MRIRLEMLNNATGCLLLASGALALLKVDIPTSLSWAIFGAMYLVMEEYEEHGMDHSQHWSKSHRIRRFFGWFGVIGSISLMVYYARM